MLIFNVFRLCFGIGYKVIEDFLQRLVVLFGYFGLLLFRNGPDLAK
jgi:hypothetical protein